MGINWNADTGPFDVNTKGYEQEALMAKQGEHIVCESCGDIFAWATRDLYSGTAMDVSLFEFHRIPLINGDEIPPCHKCGSNTGYIAYYTKRHIC